MATFWATFGKFRLLLISASGHNGCGYHLERLNWSMKTCHPSYTDKILLQLTVWAPNGCQSEM